MTSDGWKRHEQAQRRAWREMTPAQRLAWLWKAKLFAQRAQFAAAERLRSKQG